jgi:acetyltransferase
VPAYKSIEEISARVELAVVVTRPQTVPKIIEQCGRSGVKNAIVITSGFAEAGHSGAALERKMMEIARSYGVRLLGPNCLGIIRPNLGLNATFARVHANVGHLALVSQSGAICSAVLDWATSNRIGFSSVISLGGTADVDFGEILDYLIYDNLTHYILLYVEGIRDARRFMSALRSAARIKPIVLLKAGRHAGGLAAVETHSGMAGRLRHRFRRGRAPRRRRARQEHRPVVLRRQGPGLEVPPARQAPGDHHQRRRTGRHGRRPRRRSRDSARRIVGQHHAGAQRQDAADLVAAQPGRHRRRCHTEALSRRHSRRRRGHGSRRRSGHALAAGHDAADGSRQGGDRSRPADRQADSHLLDGRGTGSRGTHLLEEAGIPSFRMPETAIELYYHISTYYWNQKLLLQTPAPLSKHSRPETEGAKMLIEAVLHERRKLLSEMESKAILRAFRIPVAQTMVAHTPTESLLLAEQIGFPIAMKIDSPDILHKSEVGGVRLNITNAPAARNAYHDIIETVKKRHPTARVNGVSIEPYLARPNGRELMIGVSRDPIFGPIITFGAGGTEVEVFSDRAVALPPLNRFLARDLIQSTRASKLLGEFRNMPPVNLEALEDVLLHVSQMICELPWLQELDLNPLIVDENGGIAADARIVIDYAAPSGDRYAHMAIHPYPVHLIQDWELPDGRTVTIRPIRPEDAEREQQFVIGHVRRKQVLPLHGYHPRTDADHAGALHPDRLRPRNGSGGDPPRR